MGFKLQRITQINSQEFSTVNLLYLVEGHWKGALKMTDMKLQDMKLQDT